MRLEKKLQTALLAAALTVVPAVAQNQPAAQSQPSTSAPANNPGFGAQVPNDVTGYKGAQDNSSYQKDRNGNQGLDLGWFGLIGLFGLFGLRRKEGTIEHNATDTQPHRDMVRT